MLYPVPRVDRWEPWIALSVLVVALAAAILVRALA
jgi:hypothetical protein